MIEQIILIGGLIYLERAVLIANSELVEEKIHHLLHSQET